MISFFISVSNCYHLGTDMKKQSVKIAEDITLQSTMSNDRLNGLALMLIHRNVELNPDGVVEEFSHSGLC